MKLKSYLSRYFLLILLLPVAECSKSKVSASQPVQPVPPANDNVVKVMVDSIGSIGARQLKVYGAYSATHSSSVISRGACWATTPNPDTTVSNAEATTVNGDGGFTVDIKGLTPSSTYFVRSYVSDGKTIYYSQQQSIATVSVPGPVFSVKPIFIIGSTRAYLDVTLVPQSTDSITEAGLCWSTNAGPTVGDSKLAAGIGGATSFRGLLSPLSPQTVYHVRPYAIVANGVTYGPDSVVTTLKGGHLTAIFNKPANPVGDELSFWNAIQPAVDSALWYFNTYTTGAKTYYVNYSPGTPTADDNADGWMNFGSNGSYWNIRTVMHEMNHGMGNGTSWWWSTMIKDGVYQGKFATQALKMVQGDNNAVLYGDGMHFWPYGLNQNSEVSSSWDFVYNALIQEGMRKDGAPGAGPY